MVTIDKSYLPLVISGFVENDSNFEFQKMIYPRWSFRDLQILWNPLQEAFAILFSSVSVQGDVHSQGNNTIVTMAKGRKFFLQLLACKNNHLHWPQWLQFVGAHNCFEQRTVHDFFLFPIILHLATFQQDFKDFYQESTLSRAVCSVMLCSAM